MTVTKILHHLREIERRKLYSSLRFSSLFDYAVQNLGYSESEAYRRISAMRALTEMPELEEKITSGAISLTNVTLAQTMFRREAKFRGAPISRAKKLELLNSLAGKTTREAEKAVLKESSSPSSLMSDRMRPVGDTAVEIRFVGNHTLIDKVVQLRGLLGHSDPNLTLGELFEKLCDLGIQTWSPEFAAPKKHRVDSVKAVSKAKKISPTSLPRTTPTPLPTTTSTTTPTQIPKAARIAIWKRDQGRCTACKGRHMLEVDHIHPVGLGGGNELNNLRLLCRSCNQRAAINIYGLKKMEPFLGASISNLFESRVVHEVGHPEPYSESLPDG